MAVEWSTQPWFTYALIAINCIVYIATTVSDKNVVDYAFQYDAIVHKDEYWRAFTSQFIHADFLHIMFNMFTLFTLKYIEDYVGIINYALITLTLLCLSPLFMLCLYKIANACYPSGNYLYTYSVGYSCVLFGLFVVSASMFPYAEYNMFGQRVPAFLMPLLSLIITQLLVPSASLVGHAGGLVAGFCVGAAVRFGLVSRGQSFLMFHNAVALLLSLLAWLVLILVLQIKRRSAGPVEEPGHVVGADDGFGAYAYNYEAGAPPASASRGWFSGLGSSSSSSSSGARGSGSRGRSGRFEGGSGAVGYGEIGTGFGTGTGWRVQPTTTLRAGRSAHPVASVGAGAGASNIHGLGEYRADNIGLPVASHGHVAGFSFPESGGDPGAPNAVSHGRTAYHPTAIAPSPRASSRASSPMPHHHHHDRGFRLGDG